MTKHSTSGTEFARAMGGLLSNIAIYDLHLQGKDPSKISQKDLMVSQAKIENFIMRLYDAFTRRKDPAKEPVTFDEGLYPKMDAEASAAFFSYMIAKSIGYERALSKHRNPVKERKQIKMLSLIFREGLEHMVDRIEVETKRAVKEGLLDVEQAEKVYEEAAAADKETKDEEEMAAHEPKLVNLPK